MTYNYWSGEFKTKEGEHIENYTIYESDTEGYISYRENLYQISIDGSNTDKPVKLMNVSDAERARIRSLHKYDCEMGNVVFVLYDSRLEEDYDGIMKWFPLEDRSRTWDYEEAKEWEDEENGRFVEIEYKG